MTYKVPPGPFVDIVFEGPPGPTGATFVEVEDANGRSIKLGEWMELPRPRRTGRMPLWALRITRADIEALWPPAAKTRAWIREEMIGSEAASVEYVAGSAARVRKFGELPPQTPAIIDNGWKRIAWRRPGVMSLTEWRSLSDAERRSLTATFDMWDASARTDAASSTGDTAKSVAVDGSGPAPAKSDEPQRLINITAEVSAKDSDRLTSWAHYVQHGVVVSADTTRDSVRLSWAQVAELYHAGVERKEIAPATPEPRVMSDHEATQAAIRFEDVIEAAYWTFDATRKPDKVGSASPYTERDAFKIALRRHIEARSTNTPSPVWIDGNGQPWHVTYVQRAQAAQLDEKALQIRAHESDIAGLRKQLSHETKRARRYSKRIDILMAELDRVEERARPRQAPGLNAEIADIAERLNIDSGRHPRAGMHETGCTLPLDHSGMCWKAEHVSGAAPTCCSTRQWWQRELTDPQRLAAIATTQVVERLMNAAEKAKRTIASFRVTVAEEVAPPDDPRPSKTLTPDATERQREEIASIVREEVAKQDRRAGRAPVARDEISVTMHGESPQADGSTIAATPNGRDLYELPPKMRGTVGVDMAAPGGDLAAVGHVVRGPAGVTWKAYPEGRTEDDSRIVVECGDDAGKWAAAWMRKTFPRARAPGAVAFPAFGGPGIDEGLMIGWFANAIEEATRVRMARWEAFTKATREELDKLGAPDGENCAQRVKALGLKLATAADDAGPVRWRETMVELHSVFDAAGVPTMNRDGAEDGSRGPLMLRAKFLSKEMSEAENAREQALRELRDERAVIAAELRVTVSKLADELTAIGDILTASGVRGTVTATGKLADVNAMGARIETTRLLAELYGAAKSTRNQLQGDTERLADVVAGWRTWALSRTAADPATMSDELRDIIDGADAAAAKERRRAEIEKAHRERAAEKERESTMSALTKDQAKELADRLAASNADVTRLSLEVERLRAAAPSWATDEITKWRTFARETLGITGSTDIGDEGARVSIRKIIADMEANAGLLVPKSNTLLTEAGVPGPGAVLPARIEILIEQRDVARAARDTARQDYERRTLDNVKALTEAQAARDLAVKERERCDTLLGERNRELDKVTRERDELHKIAGGGILGGMIALGVDLSAPTEWRDAAKAHAAEYAAMKLEIDAVRGALNAANIIDDGIGGTVAERIGRALNRLDAIDSATAQLARRPQALDECQAASRRISALLVETARDLDAANVTGPGAVLPDRVRFVIAERDQLKGEYERACGQIANMHSAALGTRGEGPRRGVVEDVEDLRTDRDTAYAKLAEANEALRQLRAVRKSDDELVTGLHRVLESAGRAGLTSSLVERVSVIVAERKDLAMRCELAKDLAIRCELASSILVKICDLVQKDITGVCDDPATFDRAALAAGLVDVVARIVAERDKYKTRPWERLKELGFQVAEFQGASDVTGGALVSPPVAISNTLDADNAEAVRANVAAVDDGSFEMRNRARDIAVSAALAGRPSYWVEDFSPHAWVVDAVMIALEFGDQWREDHKFFAAMYAAAMGLPAEAAHVPEKRHGVVADITHERERLVRYVNLCEELAEIHGMERGTPLAEPLWPLGADFGGPEPVARVAVVGPGLAHAARRHIKALEHAERRMSELSEEATLTEREVCDLVAKITDLTTELDARRGTVPDEMIDAPPPPGAPLVGIEMPSGGAHPLDVWPDPDRKPRPLGAAVIGSSADAIRMRLSTGREYEIPWSAVCDLSTHAPPEHQIAAWGATVDDVSRARKTLVFVLGEKRPRSLVSLVHALRAEIRRARDAAMAAIQTRTPEGEAVRAAMARAEAAGDLIERAPTWGHSPLEADKAERFADVIVMHTVAPDGPRFGGPPSLEDLTDIAINAGVAALSTATGKQLDAFIELTEGKVIAEVQCCPHVESGKQCMLLFGHELRGVAHKCEP